MNDSLWLAYIPGLALIIGGTWGLFYHVAATAKALTVDFDAKLGVLDTKLSNLRIECLTKCQSNYDLHEVKIEALRKESQQQVERVSLTESKARHDMNNAMTAQLVKLEQTIVRIGEQAVRKEDLARVERTLDNLVLRVGNTDVLGQKFESLDKRFEGLEKRFDKFLDSWEHRKGEGD